MNLPQESLGGATEPIGRGEKLVKSSLKINLPEEQPAGACEQSWSKAAPDSEEPSHPVEIALSGGGRHQLSDNIYTQLMEEQTGEPEDTHRSESPPSPVASVMSMTSYSSRDMPLNFRAQQQATGVSAGRVQCDVSGCTNPAYEACLTCRDVYCMSCIRPHYCDPDLGKHQRQELQYQDRCEQHNKKLKFYCRIDQSAVCSRCLLHNHRGHDFIDWEETNRDQNMTKQCNVTEQGGVLPPGQLQFSSVTSDSVTVSWSPPQGAPESYRVTWRRGEEQQMLEVVDPELEVSGLLPGERYHFTVATLTKHGHHSTCMGGSVQTGIPIPEHLAVSSITASSAHLSWEVSPEMEQSPHSFLVSYQSEGIGPKFITSVLCRTVITDLKPGTEYTVRVYTQLQHGGKSQPASWRIKTGIPVPEGLSVRNITASSAYLSWEVSPEMKKTKHDFLVSYQSEGTQLKSTIQGLYSIVLMELKPGTEYSVRVSTRLDHGGESQPASVKIKTKIPVPECLTVSSITASSASLSWELSPEMDQIPHSFLVSYKSEGTELKSISTESCRAVITGLKPGTVYTIRVYTELHGEQSQPASLQKKTEIPVPECLTVSSITASSASLSWELSPEMDQIPRSFLVSYKSEGTELKSISTESCRAVITGLKPGTVYTIRVYTVLHGEQSQPASLQKKTGLLSDVLSALHLQDYEGGRLTLRSVLEINSHTISDTEQLKPPTWTFLRKLVMFDLNSRNMKCTAQQGDLLDGSTKKKPNFDSDEAHSDALHPLDLITALFHCSDPFLQQEIVTKMAMCQFAVPLLLPNYDTQQSTLMLWAMRDIVKKYRPHSIPGETTSFKEARIVEIAMPMVSFVRLGLSSLPKSQNLNKLLSSPNQHSNAFVHCDMECGDVLRRISDGLVELTWYLPSGNPNTDVFSQPVAIANLRGDGWLFETQMSFLCQTSAAVFIFCDDLEGGPYTLTNTETRAELFLVTNTQRKTFNIETLREACRRNGLRENNIVKKEKKNDIEFVENICFHVKNAIKNSTHEMKLEDITVARKLNLHIDEECDECKNAKEHVKAITERIKSIIDFKKTDLPLHGNLWKKISDLEKERCRLRKADREMGIEDYISSLNIKENEIRNEQHRAKVSEAINTFVTGILPKGTEHLYFLKWLKIQLDTLSRCDLYSLRQQYKECCRNTPQNTELMSHLDKQMSNCSLGPEHFFRELGQLYECACSIPETSPASQVQHLPGLCAQMLLDGFPVELVDGDAANIPMKWISEVLTQLHKKVESKSKFLVLSVLGVQGTGKSTLLNTMFGVQFAVSSGKCTRGAHMQLIKVSEDLRSEFQCDFIMVIDTEGLKSPELAELDTSYEHDNELATLVIGLSDITIINIAMENTMEMKDILQIVVHAFLRMKEVGKKPRCVFVHQNVSDMSAHDSNMRDRKKLVEQLDKMTLAAAKMEKKEANTKFSDVMIYDPDRDSYYIPGLWHGTPPMAPVNPGYSEAVYHLKKELIGSVQTSGDFKCNDATEFLRWTDSLLKAVKFENFIFNFRNSLVADAYSDLCTDYNKWVWSFQKKMNHWLITKETEISNFRVTEKISQICLRQYKLQEMLHEASQKLCEEEKEILENLDMYFDKKDNKVRLVEKYRQDFQTSARSLIKITEGSIKGSLERAVAIREGMEKMTKIKEQQINTIEAKVHKLLQDCKRRKMHLSRDELIKEFKEMWDEIMAELSGLSLPRTQVDIGVFFLLKANLEEKNINIKLISGCDPATSGQGEFVVEPDWFSNWISNAKKLFSAMKHMDNNHFINKIQVFCDDIIHKCGDLIKSQINIMEENNTDYHEMYIKDILKEIDDQLHRKPDHTITKECEAKLKVHLCGQATRLFQKAHEEFNVRNDPQKCLKKCEKIFQNKFLECFIEQDQCQKAQDFTNTCVKPAVENYVVKHLGQAIVDDVRTNKEVYKTQNNFQFAILKSLLDKKSFEMYKTYISSYETFVKDWVKEDIIEKMSQEGKLAKLENKYLTDISDKLIDAISKSPKDGDLKVFIQELCLQTENQLIFPQDVVRTFLSLNEAKAEPFATHLEIHVKKMKDSLAQEYENKSSRHHIADRIGKLPSKPHESIFSSLVGCGKQCPFCGAPCEAGGLEHSKHLSRMHRPVGLGQRTIGLCGNERSNELTVDICTSLVLTEKHGFFMHFFWSYLKRYTPTLHNLFHRQKDKGFEMLPNGDFCLYKDYRKVFPDWDITGMPNAGTSAYWKYVLNTYNEDFAKVYDTQPAVIPPQWSTLTSVDALTSLEESFICTFQTS